MKNYSNMFDNPPVDEIDEVVEETVKTEPIMLVGIVNAREVYIRQDPGIDKEPLGTVKKGDEVLVIGEEPGWLHIVSPNAVEAWIMANFVDVE